MGKSILGRFGIVLVLAWLLAFNGPSRQGKASAIPAAVWPEINVIRITGGLESPVHLTHAGDDSGRLFVVEQPGRIRIFDGSLAQVPFLDITDRVLSPASGGRSEEGLLSVVFPPGYASGKDHFYVYYTNLDGNNQLSRFFVTSDPNLADPDSEERLLLLNHPNFANHNGGQLFFGADGYLYIGTGDGGGGGDPQGNAQDGSSLLGKILRIDVESAGLPPEPSAQRYHLPLVLHHSAHPSDLRPYRVPPDNPFVGRSGYRDEIWALGLRNPWRFSFDRLSGNLYIGDVGQSSQEEVNFQPAGSPGGANYGWPILEGNNCFTIPNCDATGLTMPVAIYHHHQSGGDENCSITGGYVYRGTEFSKMQGIYVFGDYCSGILWGLRWQAGTWVMQELLNTEVAISSFGEDQAGELYLTAHWTGEVYRILSTE